MVNRVSSNNPVALGPKVADRRKIARLARGGVRNAKVAAVVAVTGPLAVAAAIAPAGVAAVVTAVRAAGAETGVKAGVPAAVVAVASGRTVR